VVVTLLRNASRIHDWERRSFAFGSVKDWKSGRNKIREETCAGVAASIEQSPMKSTRKRAAELGILKTTIFVSARKAIIAAAAAAQDVREEGPTKRRRTERVKREKPNYYDAMEYEKQTKKKRNRTTTIHGEHNRKGDHGDTQHRLKKKRKKKVTEEKEQEERDVPYSMFTPENSLKCFVILAEINRKIGSTSWRP
ncbi:hypothetical protein C0J52_21644, partial [Blattella germanica]